MTAERDLNSPLLSDEPQVILTVDDDPGLELLNGSTHQEPPFRPSNQNHNTNNTHLGIENPFEFLGAREFNMPGSTTLDPFRNNTARIEGVYEWLKILICLPIALVRLVLFGLCLVVGYIATKIALHGWKDKHNPMPKWRSRLMWVTRFSSRCILFSFGYHWIKRRGRPASRETAPIVVSNHVSYIEPIFFFYELFPTIVASESHDSIPFVGTIIRAMQVIYVNRFSQSSRKHAVSEIKVIGGRTGIANYCSRFGLEEIFQDPRGQFLFCRGDTLEGVGWFGMRPLVCLCLMWIICRSKNETFER